MKRLVSMGYERIFQITHAFRKAERGSHHNPEFCMLEWYIVDKDYTYLMNEVIDLIKYLLNNIPTKGSLSLNSIPRLCIDDLFMKHVGWKPSLEWNEMRYFKDFVDKIEPYLSKMDAAIIYDFPAPIASLSKLKEDNLSICERFELYLKGIEIANAFSELTDVYAYAKRFEDANIQRKRMGKREYPIDREFLSNMELGLPKCAGIALGVDRLMMAISGSSSIDDVMLFTNRS